VRRAPAERGRRFCQKKATTGYGRLSYLDAPRPADPAQVDLRAFAITPA
jgi:hypothetical protein